MKSGIISGEGISTNQLHKMHSPVASSAKPGPKQQGKFLPPNTRSETPK